MSGAELAAHSSAPAPTCGLCAEPGAALLGGCRPGPGPLRAARLSRWHWGRGARRLHARIPVPRPSAFSSVYLALSFPQEGGGCRIPWLSPGSAKELNRGWGGGPFVPWPDIPPGLSADGCRPGWQTVPAPSRPSRGKGLAGRVLLLTAARKCSC